MSTCLRANADTGASWRPWCNITITSATAGRHHFYQASFNFSEMNQKKKPFPGYSLLVLFCSSHFSRSRCIFVTLICDAEPPFKSSKEWTIKLS